MQPERKVSFYTLGCKLNFSESGTLAGEFDKAGYARVDFEDCPDVYIINTCSVTDQADKKCRQVVKRALRINPNAFVAVIGCYAQLKPDEIAHIPGVDAVLGAKEKFDVLKFIKPVKNEGNAIIASSEIKEARDFIPAFSSGDRTRSFLKIQDGCDYFCSFCTIPLARGFSRSATIIETLAQARAVAATGVKEVVLTGVNIGDFGRHHSENFLDLIRVLDTVEGIERFRISSIEPNLLTDDIIRFVSTSKKFLPHFHIPLQSGSDKILTLMRRRYLRDVFANRVNRIKESLPHACIGVDVITGFPGESDEDFKETHRFINDLDISYLHVFTYSERDDTTALRLPHPVNEPIRQERTRMLRMLSDKKKRAFYKSQLGTTWPVLAETGDEEGFMHGFTPHYIKVKIPFYRNRVNTIVAVHLKSLDSDGVMLGETPAALTVK